MAVKVSAKGQITLPREIRRILGIKPGSRIGFIIEEGGEVKLAVETEGEAKKLAGSLKRYAKTTTSKHQVLEKVKEEVASAAAKEGKSHRY